VCTFTLHDRHITNQNEKRAGIVFTHMNRSQSLPARFTDAGRRDLVQYMDSGPRKRRLEWTEAFP